MKVIGLDASSRYIGWAFVEDLRRLDSGTFHLPSDDVNERCREAFARIGLLLECHPDVACVAIESPVARFAKALIPQCFVSGAIRAQCALHDLLVCDITPAEAKRALTGSGTASKQRMMDVTGLGEHEADAWGVARAALRKVVEEQDHVAANQGHASRERAFDRDTTAPA
jgi:Holliday junction resolvasome RuvABC endonuclease subunit